MLPLRSAVEREAQTIATWPALGSPSDPTPILPALEGQATLSRFIHFRWWGEFMSLPPFLLPPHTRPPWTTQWLSTDTPILTAPHPTYTHSFKSLELKNRAEWFFLCPPSQESQMAPSPRLDPWVHSPLQETGSTGLDWVFLNLHSNDIPTWILLCRGGVSCSSEDLTASLVSTHQVPTASTLLVVTIKCHQTLPNASSGAERSLVGTFCPRGGE